MPTINMRSSANMVKGQGVGSCYDEQVKLVRNGLSPMFEVTENKRGDFDILHYHTVNPEYLAERFLKRKKSVAVGYVHFLPATLEGSLNLPGVFKKIFFRYLISFYNSMDYLITVNPAVVGEIAKCGIDKPKVFFIPNFVSSKTFNIKTPDERAVVRKRFGIPADKFVALGVGQLQTRKGVADFVETAKITPDVQFVWAGGFSFGKMSDGYDGIKEITQNPPKNVKFLGLVDRAEMPDVYNMADILFLPSFDELFPMAILEALCCKKPLLLRDIDIYKGILFDCYIKGSGVSDFSNVLLSLSNDAKLYEGMCDKAWECHLIYSEESVLKMWETLYSDAYESLKRSVSGSGKLLYKRL